MRVDDLVSAGEGRGIDVALQRADDLDQALYQAKENGRNQVVVG